MLGSAVDYVLVDAVLKADDVLELLKVEPPFEALLKVPAADFFTGFAGVSGFLANRSLEGTTLTDYLMGMIFSFTNTFFLN